MSSDNSIKSELNTEERHEAVKIINKKKKSLWACV